MHEKRGRLTPCKYRHKSLRFLIDMSERRLFYCKGGRANGDGRQGAGRTAAFLDFGRLQVRGSGLHIERLSLEGGELSLEGEIDSMDYEDGGQSRGGLLSRIFG